MVSISPGVRNLVWTSEALSFIVCCVLVFPSCDIIYSYTADGESPTFCFSDVVAVDRNDLQFFYTLGRGGGGKTSAEFLLNWMSGLKEQTDNFFCWKIFLAHLCNWCMVARIVNQTLQNLSVRGIEGLFPETSHLKICLQYMY